jgi:hypothetical protein
MKLLELFGLIKDIYLCKWGCRETLRTPKLTVHPVHYSLTPIDALATSSNHYSYGFTGQLWYWNEHIMRHWASSTVVW